MSTERDTTDLQRRAAALAIAEKIADITFDRCGGWEYDREKVADLILALSARETPPQGQDVVCSKCGFPIRDSFCGLSCDGRAEGVTVDETTRETPEPSALEQRLRNPPEGSWAELMEQAADTIAALTQTKADTEARCVELAKDTETVRAALVRMSELAETRLQAHFKTAQRLAVVEGALKGVKSPARGYLCWCDESHNAVEYGHQPKCKAASDALAPPAAQADDTPAK